jgi:ABC-type spermidine/putrescine transport system permease subunit II
VKRAPLYLLAAMVALAILIPVVYAVLGGFRDTGQIGENPVGLPDPWVFSNYAEILGSGTFWRQVWNSTLIAAVSTLLTVPLAALAAFVFARFAFPGLEVLYAVFTLGLLFPIAVAICARSSRASRTSSRTRPRSTAAGHSASSGGSSCRCLARCSPPSRSSRSWAPGTPSCCPWSC